MKKISQTLDILLSTRSLSESALISNKFLNKQVSDFYTQLSITCQPDTLNQLIEEAAEHNIPLALTLVNVNASETEPVIRAPITAKHRPDISWVRFQLTLKQSSAPGLGIRELGFLVLIAWENYRKCTLNQGHKQNKCPMHKLQVMPKTQNQRKHLD